MTSRIPLLVFVFSVALAYSSAQAAPIYNWAFTSGTATSASASDGGFTATIVADGSQSFTRDAGATIWGFPKTVERIDFDYSQEGRFRGTLEMDGEKVFEIEMPRGGDKERPASPSIGYSYIEGVPHVTSFTQAATQMGAGGGRDVEITLGSHPIADDLRSLGLPKKPLMTTWIGKMVMRFDPPEKL